MMSLGYDVKNPLVFQILSNLDKNGKGTIDFDEFLDMMTARMVRPVVRACRAVVHGPSHLMCAFLFFRAE